MGAQSLKILVCYYRDVYLRRLEPAYLNIQCGKDETGLDLAMQGDNTGDNISARNRYWSEITALYWAWKNMKPADYVGLCSYRRFFNYKSTPGIPVEIVSQRLASAVGEIDQASVLDILARYDVILPEPYSYAYSIRRVCSMNYFDRDFELLESLIHEISPEYDRAYRSVAYESNKMIGHNMFIMPWKYFVSYCEWVFSILLRLEQTLDPSDYPIRQVRVFGYMHEILLGVFIERHQLRAYHSQISWISDAPKGFKFNRPFYRLAAAVYYRTTRVLAGKNYRHTLEVTRGR